MSLAEHYESWMPAFARRRAFSTARGYASMFARHILPRFAATALTDLTRRDIRRFLKDLLTQMDVLSARYVWVALSSCLQAAEDDELIDTNPAHGAGKGLFPRKSDEPRAMPQAEVRRFLTFAARMFPHLFPLYLVMARTGMRIAEALGLQVGDVYARERCLIVRRQYRGAGRTPLPKTRRSRRVDLSRQAFQILTVLIPTARGPERWFFAHRTKVRPYHPGHAMQRFREIAAAAGLSERWTSHALRHGFATAQVERDCNLRWLQGILGHEDPATTLGYAKHAAPRDLAAVDALDTRLPPLRAMPLPFAKEA